MTTTVLTDAQKVPTKAGQDKQIAVLESMAASVGKIAQSMWKDSGTLDNYVPSLLDGTKEKYEAVQKAWFLQNGAETASPSELTALMDRWYTITRPDWDGHVQFYHPDVSGVPQGTKLGDLAQMECVPSTDTVAGKDDFAGNPLFAVTTVNWVMNGTEPQITAIRGITASYEQNNPDKYVGVVQMTGWHWWTTKDESEQYFNEGYCSKQKNIYTHIEPLPEAVRTDGTIRPWVIHAKYICGYRDSGKPTCCSGMIPRGNISHNNSHDLAKLAGDTYSGTCSVDRSFLILMARIIFGSLTLDGILNGCYAYHYYDACQIAETSTTRVIMPADWKDSIKVGSAVVVATQAFTSADDCHQKMMHNKAQRYTVTSVEEVTINNAKYTALYTDATTPFDTVAKGADTPTVVCIMPWNTGSTDSVLGNTGSLDCMDAKHAIMLQGIEFSGGQWEALSDAINKLWKDSDGKYWYTCYTVDTVANQSTDITSNYKEGCTIEQPDKSKDQYQKYLTYKNGMYYPAVVGSSSSTYTCDNVYLNGQTEGTKEFLCFGDLRLGVALYGLSCLILKSALSGAWWNNCCHLSPNGNRGVWGA